MDEADKQSWSDVAYVGRLLLPDNGRTLLVMAGVHALGSLGAVDYFARNLPELYAEVGTRRFFMVIASNHDDDTVTSSETLCAPLLHQ